MVKSQSKMAFSPRKRSQQDEKRSKLAKKIKKVKVKRLTEGEESVERTKGKSKDGSKKSTSKKVHRSLVAGNKKEDMMTLPPNPKSDKKKTKVASKMETTSTLDAVDVDTEAVVMKVKRKADRSNDGVETKEKSKKQKLNEMTKKERRLERKKENNNFVLSMQAKKMWGTLRQQKCPKPKKLELSDELFSLIKGKVKELAVAHDTSRVIQSLVAHGSPEIKEAVYGELQGQIPFMMKSVYANKIIMKFLKEGSKKQKAAILKLMHGKVTLLMRHKIASKVVEYAYNEAATTAQALEMSVEFYGPTYAIFKGDGVSSLDEIIQRDPMQKDVVLKHLKETLSSFIEKSLIRNSITHRVLHEYLRHCSVKDRTEMIESMRNYVVEILHTRDGASAAMQCVWHGTNKDRKIIIKTMKTHVIKICKEQYGHKVMLAIFDNIDDTKLVAEALLKEMMANLVELCDDPNGRRVLTHILVPRTTKYFHPRVIETLKQGDGNATSKKDVDVRIRELQLYAYPHMVKVITENMDRFTRSSAHYSFVLAVCTYPAGAMEVYEKFLEILNRPGNAKPPKMFDDTRTYHLLKQLIRADGERFKEDHKDEARFVHALLNRIPDDELVQWVTTNRGSFALLMLLETGISAVIQRINQLLKPIKKELESKSFDGAKLLFAKLK